jgi:hypothetical protein
MNRRAFSSAIARLRNHGPQWSTLADALVAMAAPSDPSRQCGKMIGTDMACVRPDGHDGLCADFPLPGDFGRG